MIIRFSDEAVGDGGDRQFIGEQLHGYGVTLLLRPPLLSIGGTVDGYDDDYLFIFDTEQERSGRTRFIPWTDIREVIYT